ncbi:MAG TPA: TIGR03086 family metal-binding protein [Rugosimonospora sp.]|nr:TIGR03086 family metal-binding protein [Rugosimonospora sp.]
MDMLSAYTDAVRRNHERVDAIRADQLSDPTPCRDWDVRELLAHLIGGYEMFAAALGQPTPPGTSPTGTADLTGRHRSVGEAAIAAFTAPDALHHTLRLPIGDLPGHMALGLALTDAVVHGWDLATATGQDTTIDDALAAILLTGAEQSITAQMRQPDGAMPVFAPPVTISPARPAADRLIAFLGRQP